MLFCSETVIILHSTLTKKEVFLVGMRKQRNKAKTIVFRHPEMIYEKSLSKYGLFVSV